MAPLYGQIMMPEAVLDHILAALAERADELLGEHRADIDRVKLRPEADLRHLAGHVDGGRHDVDDDEGVGVRGLDFGEQAREVLPAQGILLVDNHPHAEALQLLDQKVMQTLREQKVLVGNRDRLHLVLDGGEIVAKQLVEIRGDLRGSRKCI